jgi:hypothetical protein
MKQILIQLDDETAALLEKVAPGKSRKRSEFLRGAIARILQETLEASTRKAYARWPDQPPAVRVEDWAAEEEAVRPPGPRMRRVRPQKKKARK